MPANPLTDPNWADETTDTVVRVVGTVRERATTPVVYAARGAVFGLLAAILGLLAVILLLITATRLIQAALEPVTDQARAVYISYFVVGGILVLVGLFLFWKRNAGQQPEA